MVIQPSSILAMKCASTLSGAACGPNWACNGYRHSPCMHLPIMSRSIMVDLQASGDICAPLVAVHIHISRGGPWAKEGVRALHLPVGRPGVWRNQGAAAASVHQRHSSNATSRSSLSLSMPGLTSATPACSITSIPFSCRQAEIFANLWKPNEACWVDRLGLLRSLLPAAHSGLFNLLSIMRRFILQLMTACPLLLGRPPQAVAASAPTVLPVFVFGTQEAGAAKICDSSGTTGSNTLGCRGHHKLEHRRSSVISLLLVV